MLNSDKSSKTYQGYLELFKMSGFFQGTPGITGVGGHPHPHDLYAKGL